MKTLRAQTAKKKSHRNKSKQGLSRWATLSNNKINNLPVDAKERIYSKDLLPWRHGFHLNQIKIAIVKVTVIRPPLWPSQTLKAQIQRRLNWLIRMTQTVKSPKSYLRKVILKLKSKKYYRRRLVRKKLFAETLLVTKWIGCWPSIRKISSPRPCLPRSNF